MCLFLEYDVSVGVDYNQTVIVDGGDVAVAGGDLFISMQ